MGDPQAVHTFTYTPDIARALLALAESPAAFGQTWHLPTAREMENGAVTGRALSGLACSIANQPIRLQVAPRWLFKIMGWFAPTIRENNEMLYQLEHPYRFDSRKAELALGLQATSYRAGLEQTWRSLR